MSEELFRIVITAAVGLACIAFIVQAGVVLALYRAARKMQDKVEPLMERAKPIMERVPVLMDKAKPAVEKTGPLVESVPPPS